MWNDPAFLAVGVPAAVFGGVSKGGFGSGAAFGAAAMLALVAPPAVALAVLLPLFMIVDAAAMRAWWGRWSARESLLLIAGGLPGVALGVAVWSAAPAEALRALIGTVCLAFVGWRLCVARGWVREAVASPGAPLGLAAGVGAGFTSFVSHAGGPIVALYLLGRGLSKEAYQASTVLVFAVINIFKIGPYVALGFFGRDVLAACAVLAPFALLGTWLGVRAHRAVPERLYFMIAYALLTATGVKLIWDAL